MFIVNLKRCAVLAGVAHNAVASDCKFFSIFSKLASSLWSPARCAPTCPRPNAGCSFFLRNYACFLSRLARVLVSMVCASSWLFSFNSVPPGPAEAVPADVRFCLCLGTVANAAIATVPRQNHSVFCCPFAHVCRPPVHILCPRSLCRASLPGAVGASCAGRQKPCRRMCGFACAPAQWQMLNLPLCRGKITRFSVFFSPIFAVLLPTFCAPVLAVLLCSLVLQKLINRP